MHGAGNDFVILDLRETSTPPPELCRALADRHTGVGCDLIIGVKKPNSMGAVVSYGIWSANGSPSQQCGNGARCIAAWILREGLAQGPQFVIESPSGSHVVDVLAEKYFRIAMGVPLFSPEQIPLFGFDNEQSLYEVELEAGLHVYFSAVSMGNPHAVIEVKDIDAAPVSQVGQVLQKSHFFLPTVNVGFTEIMSRDHIRLRVYEYGAGETLACGSGACAAAAVLMKQGRINRQVSVSLPGGELYITWPGATAQILMAGPAEFAYEGEFPYGSLQQHS